MFSFHKPKNQPHKHSKLSLDLDFSVNLRADSETIMSTWGQLNMHAEGNNGINSEEMDASYTTKVHCDSKEDLLRAFDRIWKNIPYLCGKFPDKISEMKFQLTLKGNLGKKTVVDELYTDITDLSSFHDFLRKYDLIPLDKLPGKLTLEYGTILCNASSFTNGGSSVDITVTDYQQQIKHIKEYLKREKEFYPSPLLKDILSLTVVGRIDAHAISAKFDNMDALEKFLDDKFNHKLDSSIKASPF
jgi:hypothetical protein